MGRHQIENVVAVLEWGLILFERVAEHLFAESVVIGGGVSENRLIKIDGPAGEGAGGLIDIAINVGDGASFGVLGDVFGFTDTEVILRAEGVEFEEFAGEVFVGTDDRVHEQVEVMKHGEALGDRLEQGPEVSEEVGPDDIAVVVGPERPYPVVGGVDVEVVMPEICQDLGELSAAVDGANVGGPLGLVDGLVAYVIVVPGVDVVILPQRFAGFLKGGQPGCDESCFDRGIVESRWVELLFDPSFEAGVLRGSQGVESFKVARAKAEPRTGQSDHAEWRQGRRRRGGIGMQST